MSYECLREVETGKEKIGINDILGKTEEKIMVGRSRCRPQDVEVKETGR